MNECEHARRLSAYHDGEVAGAEREALEAHLAQCPACAAELARLRRLSSLLTQAERPKMPAGVLNRLHRSADDLAAADLRRVAKTFLAAAASILLVCGIWLWQANGAAEPAEAIDGIHAGGGLAILAHPSHLNCANTAQLRRVCRWLAHAGLDGIEAYHPDHTDAQTRAVLALAGELGLLVSGGSDFHGPNKPEVRMGLPRAPLAVVEQLLAKLRA